MTENEVKAEQGHSQFVAREPRGAGPRAVAMEGNHRPAQGRAHRHSGDGSVTLTSVVSAKGLGLTFATKDGDVVALSDVNLEIGKGEFVSFIGPSGCGKTTFLRVIADLEQPTAGSITVNGMSPQEARVQRAYGYVFQAPALYPWRTIDKNVALPLEIMGLADRGRGSGAPSTSSTSRASRRNIPGSFQAACSSALDRPRARLRRRPAADGRAVPVRSTRSCATISTPSC